MSLRFYAFAPSRSLEEPVVCYLRALPKPDLAAELFPGTLRMHGAEDFVRALMWGRGNHFIAASMDSGCLYPVLIPGPYAIALALRLDAVRSCDGSQPLARLLLGFLAGLGHEAIDSAWVHEVRAAANELSSGDSHPRGELIDLVRDTQDSYAHADRTAEKERIINIILRYYAEGQFFFGARWVVKRSSAETLRALHDELMAMSTAEA